MHSVSTGRKSKILAWIGGVFVVACCGTVEQTPAPNLKTVRQAACTGDPNTVLAAADAIDPASLDVNTAIVLGRYRAVAFHEAGRRNEFAQEVINCRQREAEVTGPLPVELGLEYGELAFWSNVEDSAARTFGDVATFLDTQTLALPPDAAEPESVGIPGCATRPRRSLAQAKAMTRLRLGTIALNTGHPGKAERFFTDGLQILKDANQIPDHYQGRSYSALLNNNWSEVLLRYDPGDKLANEKRLTAFRLAQEAGADKTLGIVAAGLAFQAGMVTESGADLSPYLVASCVAEQRLALGFDAQDMTALSMLAKITIVRAWYEARMFGTWANDIDVRIETAVALATTSGLPMAETFVRFYTASTLASQGRWREAASKFIDFLDSLATLWTTHHSQDFQLGMFRYLQHWLSATLHHAVENGDAEVVLAAMEHSKDIGLLLRYRWGVADSSQAALPVLAGVQDTTPTSASTYVNIVSSVGLSEVQQDLLGHDEVLIQFDKLPDSDSLVTLVITRTAAAVVLTQLGNLDDTIAHYRNAMANFGDAAATDETARELYGRLIQPIEVWLQDAKATHLLLVPRGSLHSLPWATLRSPQGYLVEKYALSVLPSATHLRDIRRRRDGRPHKPTNDFALLVGAPYFNASEELKGLGKIERMTEIPVLRTPQDVEQGIDTSVLHVKAHAVYDQADPGRSALWLNSLHDRDGKLPLTELAKASLTADLVVLQSCEAARTEEAPGDQMDSFTRAFLAAGAMCVVAPLWELPVSLTQTFAANFYDRIKNNATGPAETLRQVQLAMLRGDMGEEARSPALWGIYVATGSCSPESGRIR